MAQTFQLKKVRKFFPKKGPERKAFMFLSNLSKIDKRKVKEVYKKVLESKSSAERKVLIKSRKVFASRKEIFGSFSSLVNTYRAKEHSFWGVIIFGGVVKKSTPPTDLDFIFVGELSDKSKAEFCSTLYARTGVPPNPFPVEVNLEKNPKCFEQLLSIPYLHNPREWTVQNFVGPIEQKRKLVKAYNLALKRIKPVVSKV